MEEEHEELCYVCNSVAERVEERRETVWGRRKVTVDDEFYRSTSCGEQFYDGAMAQEHNRRTAAAIGREDG